MDHEIENKPVRILVTGAASIGKAGVATIVYKWGQEFDSSKVVYDYLMQKGLPDQYYLDAIAQKGGRVFTMKNANGNQLSTVRWVGKIVKENNYEIMHINTDTAYIAAAYIYAAKKGGIRHIFVHSHCTQVDDNNKIRRSIRTILHKLAVPYVCKNTEKFLACSKIAGDWMFGKSNVESDKYQTIYNGVAVEQYLFNETIRNKYRRRMGLEEKIVIGNVGRFSYQKNHEFLIKMFAEYVKAEDKAVLVLVGNGELESRLKTLVKELSIAYKVLFLGVRNDIPALLSMFDILVMPSRFEGLPVTMVEAQMADLPCVVSGNITTEAKFTPKVEYVSGFNYNDWIKAIESMRNRKRRVNAEEKTQSSFNIRKASVELQSILLSEE